jgi:hypothetical protein
MKIKDEVLDKIGDEYIKSPELKKKMTFWEYLIKRISALNVKSTVQ